MSHSLAGGQLPSTGLGWTYMLQATGLAGFSPCCILGSDLPHRLLSQCSWKLHSSTSQSKPGPHQLLEPFLDLNKAAMPTLMLASLSLIKSYRRLPSAAQGLHAVGLQKALLGASLLSFHVVRVA